MILDDLQQFTLQMKDFQEDLILVKYNNIDNTFTFQQREKTVISSNISYMYFPVKWKYGILMYSDYLKLMESLSDIVSKLSTKYYNEIFPQIKKGRVSFICRGSVLSNGFYPGPKTISRVKFASITNRFIVKFLLKFYSENSRAMYNYIKLFK